MSGNAKTFCRITDYVDSVNPELSQLLHHTCADMQLNTLKEKPGVTFLMPTDPAYIEEISRMAYSENTEDANAACDMLNALILRDVFRSPMDFKSREVANSLIVPQVLTVDSTTSTEVVFSNGARASLDTNFRDGSRKQNLAVWRLSGRIPVTNDKPAKLGGCSKTGAYEVTNYNSMSERFKIAIAVENAYALCRLQCEHGDRGNQHRDVYVENVLSLVHHIINVRGDMALFMSKVLPLISLDKIDFYLLVEPHRQSGNFLLSADVIHDWWAARLTCNCDYAQICRKIEECLNGSGPLVYSGRAQLMDRLAGIRSALLQQVAGRPREIVDKIEQHYMELEQSNTIGGLGPVYPPELAQYYAENSGLKMLHDELRFITYGAFKELEHHLFDYGRFNEIVNMIGECLLAGTANERARSQKLLNKNTLKYMIAPSENVSEIKVFIYSTMFMYIPLTRDEAENMKAKHTVRRPSPTSIIMFNISKDLYTTHKRLLMSGEHGASAAQIADMLRSLDPATLDPSVRELIRNKFA